MVDNTDELHAMHGRLLFCRGVIPCSVRGWNPVYPTFRGGLGHRRRGLCLARSLSMMARHQILRRIPSRKPPEIRI